ncbi:hypothetical protein D3C84_1027620 [compost metagenome]
MSNRYPIACGNIGICCVAEQLSRTTGAKDRGVAAHKHALSARLLNKYAVTFAVLGNQVDHEVIVPDLNIRILLRTLRQCSNNFSACRVAVRMQNTTLAMRPFFG